MPHNPFPEIRPVIGEGTLSLQHRGRDFLRCLLELIKNSLDKQASVILIDTLNRGAITIVDNGIGANDKARDRFCSVHDPRSEASGHGKFGWGTKDIFYSYGRKMRMRTITDQHPGLICEITLDTGSYERQARTEKGIKPNSLDRNTETWPYPFRTGAEVTVTYEDASKRTILRGKRLAQLLAARLPSKFQRIIQVDGEWLPEPERQGDPFIVVDNSFPQLGPVGIELFRPAPDTRQAQRHRGIWLAGEDIGDADIRALHKVLTPELRDLFPEEWLLADLEGTLTNPTLFHHFTNADRESISPAICDGQAGLHLVDFITILRKYTSDILTKFGLRQDGVLPGRNDEGEIRQLMEQCNRLYGPDGPPRILPGRDEQGPGNPSTDEEVDNEQADDTPTGSPIQLIGLRKGREYAIGETFEAKAWVRRDLTTEIDLGKIRWMTDNTLTNVTHPAPGQIRAQVTDHIGRGRITADLSSSILSATANYDVVSERHIRLIPDTKTVFIGERLTLTIGNADRVDGKIVWSHSGPGEFATGEKRCDFLATTRGSVEVSAHDSADPNVIARATITVIPQPETDMICIRGTWFKLAGIGFSLSNEFKDRPAVLSRGGRYHDVFFNRTCPAYQQALEDGSLKQVLALALAHEYPRFARFELDPEETDVDTGREDPRDLSHLTAEIQTEAWQIYSEIMMASARH